jgi:tRNA pseudouridine38-40 synthase
MKNIKLTIEYDGTNYHGWQSQINALAIQDVVSAAIKKLTGETCNLIGSSRTDEGVHALGQVANFTTNSNIPGDRFSFALNSVLPKNIVVRNSEEVDLCFHSRFFAKGKKYKYLIFNSQQPSALFTNRAYHCKSTLDVTEMNKAASCFLGKHDFSAFKSTGSNVKSNVRTITSVLCEKKDEFVEFQISGDGFLYNMVRIIVGTLISVGQKKTSSDEISRIIDSMDRRRAGKTAPAHGLYLVEVYY